MLFTCQRKSLMTCHLKDTLAASNSFEILTWINSKAEKRDLSVSFNNSPSANTLSINKSPQLISFSRSPTVFQKTKWNKYDVLAFNWLGFCSFQTFFYIKKNFFASCLLIFHFNLIFSFFFLHSCDIQSIVCQLNVIVCEWQSNNSVLNKQQQPISTKNKWEKGQSGDAQVLHVWKRLPLWGFKIF